MPPKSTDLLKELLPPMVVRAARRILPHSTTRGLGNSRKMPEDEFADLLEYWAAGNAWNEIQLLMAGRKGRVIDIGCGVGVTISLLQALPLLDVYGCDRSGNFIRRAIRRGVSSSRVTVADGSALHYPDGFFDWGYTIGVLHYLSEGNILRVLRECYRVVAGPSFHQIPVDRQGKDMGFVQTFQTVQNNSLPWWKAHFASVYPRVEILGSSWSDDNSIGKWIICSKI
jgi:SAM-dependent methyltransferase